MKDTILKRKKEGAGEGVGKIRKVNILELRRRGVVLGGRVRRLYTLLFCVLFVGLSGCAAMKELGWFQVVDEYGRRVPSAKEKEREEQRKAKAEENEREREKQERKERERKEQEQKEQEQKEREEQ